MSFVFYDMLPLVHHIHHETEPRAAAATAAADAVWSWLESRGAMTFVAIIPQVRCIRRVKCNLLWESGLN